ncbi:MAG: NADH-quinone oxidoreductase subunit L [Gemmatimonadota bacterium]
MLVGSLILVPVLAAGLILLFASRHPGDRRISGGLAVGAAISTLALAVAALLGQAHASWAWNDRLGIEMAVRGFGGVMIILVPLISACVLAYAASEEDSATLPRLLALLLLFIGAMEMLVLAGDLLTLLVGFELVGILSWTLIGFSWRDPENGAAANHAFLATRLGDLGLFVAAGVTFGVAGSVSFEAVSSLSGNALDVAAAGVLVAAVAKSAQLPFSAWLFSAMRGPTPVSALLHSATMVAAGAYVLIRLAPAFEPTGWFLPAVAGVGLATALAGGIVACFQSRIKDALAASTSAQYGLMFIAIGAGSTVAASTHLVVHAAFKALLFLGAGAAIHAAGTAELGRMRLGSRARLTGLLFGVGALALAAVPPLGGAFSKEAVLAVAGSRSVWLGIGVVAAGFLTAFYAARLQLLAFGRGDGPIWRLNGAPKLGLGFLAFLSLLLGGLWLPGGEDLVERVLGGPLANGPEWVLGASLTSLAVAFAIAGVMSWRGGLVSLGVGTWARDSAATWLGLLPLTREGVGVLVLGIARWLAVIDDRVVDAGIRAAAHVGSWFSRIFASVLERGADAVVQGIADGTVRLAMGTGVVDDSVLDGAVEGVASGVGVGGRQSRRIQTGLLHHYYLIVSAGFAAAVFLLFWLR